MTNHIKKSCGIQAKKNPTIIYEDNTTCIQQLKEGYIKNDRTKHIPPKFFAYTQELIKNNEIDVKYVNSSDNPADIFTKSLPTAIFRKHVNRIGMRHLHSM